MERQRSIEPDRHPDEVSVFERYSIPTALTNIETIRFLAEQEERKRNQIQGDPRPQQLQQVADLHKNHVHVERLPQVEPAEKNNWLQTLKEKWQKKLKK